MVKYSINNISKTIEAVFLELGTTNVYHKRNKLHPYSSYHDNSFAAGAVSVKTEIPNLFFEPAPSTAATCH